MKMNKADKLTGILMTETEREDTMPKQKQRVGSVRESTPNTEEKETEAQIKTAMRADLPKRFYANVHIIEAPLPSRHKKESDENHAFQRECAEMESRTTIFQILLDKYTLKTPARHILFAPSRALAELVAEEFRAQKNVINPETMPITRLVNTVIDGVLDDMQPLQEDILRAAAADMVLYRADSPRELQQKQQESWDKVLEWVWETMGVELQTGTGIMFIPQKGESLAAVGAYLRRLLAGDSVRGEMQEKEMRRASALRAPFIAAALHLMTSISGSAFLAFMVESGALTAQEAWHSAQIEEMWTERQWGRDKEAARRRAARERDFYAAAAVSASLKAPLSAV